MTALYHFQEGWICYLLCLNMGSSLLEVLQWTPSGLLFSCTLTALWHCSLLPFYFSFMFIGLSGLNCKHFLKYNWRIFCRSSVFIHPFLAVTNLNWKKKKTSVSPPPTPIKWKKTLPWKQVCLENTSTLITIWPICKWGLRADFKCKLQLVCALY